MTMLNRNKRWLSKLTLSKKIKNYKELKQFGES